MYDQERQSKSIECLTKYLQYFKTYFSLSFSLIQCHAFPAKFNPSQLETVTQKITQKKFDIAFEESPFNLWISENAKSYIDRFYMRIAEFLEYRLNVFKGPDADRKISSVINNFISGLHKFFKMITSKDFTTDKERIVIAEMFFEIESMVRKLFYFIFDHLEKSNQKSSIHLEEINFSKKLINEEILVNFSNKLQELQKESEICRYYFNNGDAFSNQTLEDGGLLRKSRSKSEFRVQNFYSLGSKSLRQSKMGDQNNFFNIRRLYPNVVELQTQKSQNLTKKSVYAQNLAIMDIQDIEVYSRDYIMEELQRKNTVNKQMIKKYFQVCKKKAKKHKNRALFLQEAEFTEKKDFSVKKIDVLNFEVKSKSEVNVNLLQQKIAPVQPVSIIREKTILTQSKPKIETIKIQTVAKPLTQGNLSKALQVMEQKQDYKSKSESIRHEIIKSTVNQNPQFETNRETFAFKEKEKMYFQSLKNKMTLQNQKITKKLESFRSENEKTVRKMDKISIPMILETPANDYRKMFRNNLKRSGAKGSSFLSNKTDDQIKGSNSDIFSKNEFASETYDQPFFKKPALASSNLLLQQQLADWVHQIYFDQKKLNQLSVLRLVEHPLQPVKPNIKCSIMYGIIREKVQQVCKSIRQLIIDSYRKLNTKKQSNSDLKHSSDSWNLNFSKFRKANIQTGMNKVYGPIAHIICTYHNSLLDCNAEVYSLWKILYHYSDFKDLELKTLQGSLNELILEELMQDYPNNEMMPKDIMPTLSSFSKHEFIFKEMWGFQKRKLAVQFHSKSQETLQQPEKQRQNSLMNAQNMPRRVEKGQVLSPPKPIPLSHKQFGVNTLSQEKTAEYETFAERQKAKKKALEEEIQFMELEEQFSDVNLQTRNKILQHIYDFKRAPTSDKEKEETLKTIEKIILNNINDDEQNMTFGTEDIDLPEYNHHGEEVVDENQETESDEQNDELVYDDDNQIDEEIQNYDLIISSKLRHHQRLEEYRNFNRQMRAKRLLNSKQQEIRARETGERYIKLCQRLQKIKETYKAAGIEFKDPELQKALDREARMIEDIRDVDDSLPELIPIKKSEPLDSQKSQKPLPKVQQKQPLKPKPIPVKLPSETEKDTNKSKPRDKPLKIQSSAYSLRLDQETQAMKKQSLYQKLKRYYETNTYEEFYCNEDETKDQKKTKNQNINKKHKQSEIFFGKNVPLEALADLISDKGKSISHAFSSNTKLSSKLQKISRQQILDQIYEVAKQKQKRDKKTQNIRKDIKLTYKKISYEVRSGDEKNQIKITKGELTSDDLGWFEDLSEKAKYHLSETTEYSEKLIDEPNEDICQDEKPQKKKKKKKKKKSKQKKELSEENDNNLEKDSNESLNDEEQDLESLQEFKKKSISDLFNLRKMMGWPEGQTLHEYLESSERLQRQKEQELLMEKKIEIYEKNGLNEKNTEKDKKAASKEIKNKRDIYSDEEIKLFQFLQSLEVKEDNREKCVVSEETLQKIIMKRKQIKSLEIFEKAKERAESTENSLTNKNDKEKSEELNEETSKASKPKNKKKKK